MINFAIIDKNIKYREYMLQKCRNILNEYEYTLKEYASVESCVQDTEYANQCNIFIIDEEFISSKNFKRLKKLYLVNKNMNIMFYGSQNERMLKAYEMDPFYFVLKQEMEEKLKMALCRGIQRYENKKARIF